MQPDGESADIQTPHVAFSAGLAKASKRRKSSDLDQGVCARMLVLRMAQIYIEGSSPERGRKER